MSQNIRSMDVIPGQKVGPFVIGMSISEVIELLTHEFRGTHGQELFYSDENPLSVDIILRLSSEGIQLRFSPVEQLLRIIEVFDFSKLRLVYGDSCFSSALEIPTYQRVYNLFGVAIGDYDSAEQRFQLQYSGLSFFFPVPSLYDNKFKTASKKTLPNEFPNKQKPTANRLCVYSEEFIKNPKSYRQKRGFTQLEVVPGRGFSISSTGSRVMFGDSCQDVLHEIGSPSKVYYKTDHRMKIWTPDAAVGTKCRDYFYNYFHYGIDLLFDALTHRVKKIILHTNFPGHFDFNIYSKCNFIMKMPSNREQEANSTVLSGDSKWSEFQKIFGTPQKPVPYKRGTSTNPFKPTELYGYENVIFEVMENNFVASAILLPTPA